ncbi:bifunctional UDP-sugar hydrolase/5'-nucleotidase, partial [Halobacteriovorax sp.]|uniref:bifunctional metallophosphatase/5'-nucleotidase n=1 Tax=Halobacteriovorax sp. TaxID=2020862 RepID=UPI00356888D4
MKSLFFIYLILFSMNINAVVVQILHTNDLHSYYDHTIIDSSRGSYAALKAKMDELENLSDLEGIKTFRFDAGDFLDGNLYYMADRGRRGFRMMEKMGFDAIAVGNHDWLMGGKELNEILKEKPPQFHYLGANFKAVNPLYTSIKKYVRPFTSFEVDGVKIGVLGLTTDELFYKWRFTGGDISDPKKVGAKVSTEMKYRHGHDFVIGLSHVGLSTDREIIKKSKDIDLLIGGHSHTAILNPLMVRNSEGKYRPIVQTGSHARFLGQMKVELIKGKPLKILEYKLIPIYTADRRDEVVDEFVDDSRAMLNQKYGEEFLQEVLGESEIMLRNSEA